MNTNVTGMHAAREISSGEDLTGLAIWSGELIDMQSEVSAAQDFSSVMEIVTRKSLGLMGSADGVAVALVEKQKLHVHHGCGTLSETSGLTLDVEGTLAAQVIETNSAAIVADAESDERIDPAHFAMIGARSILVVPIPFRGRSIGTLTFHATRAGAFNDVDLIIAQLCAGPLAVGFSAARGAMAERERDTENRRFLATFEQAAVGIAHLTPDGRFILANDRFCAITGHSQADLAEKSFHDITLAEDRGIGREELRALLAGTSGSFTVEKRYVREDGHIIWAACTVSLVREATDAADFLVAILQDISARKLAEQDARRDTLTGMPNRRALEAALAADLQSGQSLAIAYMDLDGFKQVNDQLGHEEGDHCLQAVAASLQKTRSGSDRIGRWGGDEFLAVIHADSEELASEKAKLFQAAVRETGHAEGWAISASVGVLFIPYEAVSTGTVPQDLVKLADRLMYVAKQTRSDELLVQSLAVPSHRAR